MCCCMAQSHSSVTSLFKKKKKLLEAVKLQTISLPIAIFDQKHNLWWGENWGIILVGDRCNGRSVKTTVVASLLPWIRLNVLSSVTSCYLSVAPRKLLFSFVSHCCFTITSTFPSRSSSCLNLLPCLLLTVYLWPYLERDEERWLNEHGFLCCYGCSQFCFSMAGHVPASSRWEEEGLWTECFRHIL